MIINPYLFGLTNVLTKLSVKIKATDETYLSGFQTGANVISHTQISPDLTPAPANNANTGLCYDIANDLIVVNDFINTKFYDRSLSVQRTLTPAGNQGMTIDPTTQYLYKLASASSLQVTDAVTGAVIASHTIDPAITTDGSLFFDFYTGTMYIANETPAILVRKYELIGTVWTQFEEKWWGTNEGNTIDYVLEKMVAHASLWLMECDPDSGLYRRQYNYPTAAQTANAAFREGIFADPRDGTVWFNYPGWFHGSVANTNEIWHVDPRTIYKKYIRFPDMIRYDAFKVSGTKSGLYNRQQIQSGNWNISPVIDFLGTLTGQQTLGNWEGVGLENFDLEFRGSATAPDTTATAATDYNDCPYYDANQTSDGWGTTSPGAWQSTPTTDRYMQFRIKPTAPTVVPPSFLPSDIADSKIWLEFDNKDWLWVADPTLAVERAVNLMSPGTGDFNNATVAQQPTFNVAGLYTSEDDLDNLILNALSLISGDQQGELTVVYRREAAANLAVPLSASRNGSNNNYIWFGWFPSGGATTNAPGLRYSDGAGALNTMLAPADSGVTFKMLSYASDGATWTLYKDKVSQTLTPQAGTNTGAWFADVVPDISCIGGYYIAAFGNARSRIRFLHYSSTPLTTQERSNLFDYCTSKGFFA